MLTLSCAEFAYDHRDELYHHIDRHVADGRRTFLIVPEQQTLQVEKEASRRLPEHAPLCFEVTNFSRLANTAFREVGGLSQTYSTATAKALIMWQALTQTAAVRHRHTRHDRDVGAADVQQALAALKDMQSLGIQADALADAAMQQAPMLTTRLREKMQDLSVLSSAFYKLHNERFADVGEDVEALARALKKHIRLFDGAALYIDGFTSFTEPQLHVLEQLLSRCDTTVFLTLPKAQKDNFEYTETRRTAERLLHLADLVGVPKKRVFLVGNTRIKDEGLYDISRVLWQTNSKIDNTSLQNTKNHLKILSSDTPYDASEFLASYIQKSIQEGAHYRDFAIVMRHADQYRGILDAALTESRIPFFMSEKRDITAFEAVKLIDSAYRIILTGYKREDVIAYAKCALSGIAPEACDRFELYTERWRLTGAAFTREHMWNMNPDGYTDRWRAQAEAEVCAIDETRRTLLSPLMDLAARHSDAHTVAEHARVLLSFMLQLQLDTALRARADTLRRMGETAAAQENEQLFSILCDTLQHMVDVMGNASVDTRAFHDVFMIACATTDIGHIPSAFDCVTVGSADMLRVSDKPHVILFGVHDGEFPATQTDGAWFTEQEKRALFNIGLTPECTDHLGTARELFIFSRAFTAASDTVTLLTCRRSASFKPQRPASPIHHMLQATSGEIVVIPTDTLSTQASVYTPAHALSVLSSPQTTDAEAAALRTALQASPIAAQLRLGECSIFNDNLVLTKATSERLYGGDIALTQSRLESFLSCPLRHFLTYVLRLDDNSRATFDAMNIGTFVHAILETFFQEAKEANTDFKTLSKQACHDAVARIAEDYIRRINSDTMQNTVRLKHFLRRLTKTAGIVTESIVEELRDSAYQPSFFELPIKRHTPNAPEPVWCHTKDGHGVFIYGTIDRVDTFVDGDEVYVRVVDYKTGHKTFSPSDLKDGQNLQMFLYLRAVAESEQFARTLGAASAAHVHPGGVLYVGTQLTVPPLSTPDAQADDVIKAAQSRRGMLLDDARSIAAMNPKFIPIKYKKDGTPDKYSAERLYSEAGWGELCELISDRVCGVAHRMKTGAIPADPLKRKQQTSTCEHCPYKPVCRNARL